MIEEVDFDFFTKVDGSQMAVPVGEKPPAVVCVKDRPSLKGCHGRCPDYRDSEEE